MHVVYEYTASSPGRELAQSGRVEPFPALCSPLHAHLGLDFLCHVTKLRISHRSMRIPLVNANNRVAEVLY